MTAWLTIMVAGAASFALRFVPARLLVGRPRPPLWDRALALVGPAAFAALAASALVTTTSDSPPAPARVAAVAVVVAVARIRRSTTTALAVGLPTLWLASALAPT